MPEFNLASEYAQFGPDELTGAALPEGEYDAQVNTATAAQTQGGKACIKLSLRVLNGPLAGRTLPDQLTWSPESPVAAKMFVQALTMLGATPQWVQSNQASLERTAEHITGAQARIKVTHREWPQGSGQMRANVNYTRGLSSTPAAAPAAAPVTRLAPAPEPQTSNSPATVTNGGPVADAPAAPPRLAAAAPSTDWP